MNIYSSGQYKKNHPSWHDEDAPWKANEIIRFIKKNNLKLNSVLDIGCGTGRILELVSKSLDIKSATGYEPYEEVIKEASRRFPKLNFSKTLPKKKYDLALLIDVVEHIENVICFAQRFGGSAYQTFAGLEHDRRYLTNYATSPLLVKYILF